MEWELFHSPETDISLSKTLKLKSPNKGIKILRITGGIAIDDLEHQVAMFTAQTERTWFFLAWTWKRQKGYAPLYKRKHVSAMNISLDMTKRACGKTTRTRELAEHNRDLHIEMMLKGIEPGPFKRAEWGDTFPEFSFACFFKSLSVRRKFFD